MWWPFTWITLSILCLKFSTEARSSSWDAEVIASEHQYLDEQWNRPLPPTKTTQKSPRDSNQAMREATFPYSRILESDVGTSPEFFWKCGMVHHLVGR